MHENEIYNEFDHLLDLIREEMEMAYHLSPESEEYKTFDGMVKILTQLRDNSPKEKSYMIDLQSFSVSAYNAEQAKATAIESLRTGDETATIDNVIPEEE